MTAKLEVKISLEKSRCYSFNSRDKSKADDLTYWDVRQSLINNEPGNLDNEERALASSVNLLLKNRNISQTNPVRLPAHLVPSETCQCQRSFHLFCTHLFSLNDSDTEMIYIHPAPRHHDRDSSRRVSTASRKSRQKHSEENDHETIVTARSEPSQSIPSESQLLEKKLRFPPKLSRRTTTSLNIPATYHSSPRSFPSSIKYTPSFRMPKPSPLSNPQLNIRALSVFDHSPSASQVFLPRGPPPSPKTPTQEASMIFSQSTNVAPLRAVSMKPRARYANEEDKQLTNTLSVKKANYEDHAREYLSASDCSDNEKEKDADAVDTDDDKDLDEILTITKPKLPLRNPSLSRPGTALRDRLFSYPTNRYLSLAEVYYSSLDVYKNLSDKTRQRLRSKTRLATSTNENEDAATTVTKITATTKTAPMPQSKSVFGFSKTASSMHFGHAAGRLGLQGSFEKWPQPISRRTPIERKQEVTTLRLATLPLVTS